MGVSQLSRLVSKIEEEHTNRTSSRKAPTPVATGLPSFNGTQLAALIPTCSPISGLCSISKLQYVTTVAGNSSPRSATPVFIFVAMQLRHIEIHSQGEVDHLPG